LYGEVKYHDEPLHDYFVDELICLRVECPQQFQNIKSVTRLKSVKAADIMLELLKVV
jgi:hypothetical protein